MSAGGKCVYVVVRLRKIWAAIVNRGLFRAAIRAWVFASIEHRSVLSNPWRTIVDIGANRGQFTLAALTYSDANIYAFEPLSAPAATFRLVAGNAGPVELFQYAIGRHSGDAIMHVSARDDSSSLLEIGTEQTKLFPGTSEIRQEAVEVRRLHDVLKPNDVVSPALLKLDVQGFEYEALLGCADMLRVFDSVYCECSFVELYKGQKLASDVVTLLSIHGFGLVGVHNVTFDSGGRAIQADLLFSRSI